MSNVPALLVTGYVRLPQIVGDPKADPPIPAIFPVGRSTWWAGVKSGRYPRSVKLGPRTTAWRATDIRELIDRLSQEAEHSGRPYERRRLANAP